MKKFLLSAFVVITFIGYALQQRFDDDETKVIPPVTQTAPIQTSTPITAQGSTPPPTSKPLTGAFRDGQYMGNVADAFYGNLQVKAVITNGKISDVQFLQYPNDRRTSIQINEQAMPLLKQEAIQIGRASC